MFPKLIFFFFFDKEKNINNIATFDDDVLYIFHFQTTKDKLTKL